MTDKIPCDYRTHKHIPSRSCYQLILEVSEELFPLVCDTLGFPKAGENIFVNVELSTPENIKEIRYKENSNATTPVAIDKPVSKDSLPTEPVIRKSLTTEKIEGEKLRTRACIECKNPEFQEFVIYEDRQLAVGYQKSEDGAREFIIDYCIIKSRSDLYNDKEAQSRFLNLMDGFNNWKRDQQYEDNFSRM